MSEHDADVSQVAATLRLILLAMAGGVALLLTVVVFLYARSPAAAPPPSSLRLLNLLSGADAVVFLSAWTASAVVFTALAEKRTASAFQSAAILRAALREGSSLLGLVVCLLGSFHGGLRAQPLLWLNAAPALLFIGWTLVTLPDAGSIQGRLQP